MKDRDLCARSRCRQEPDLYFRGVPLCQRDWIEAGRRADAPGYPYASIATAVLSLLPSGPARTALARTISAADRKPRPAGAAA